MDHTGANTATTVAAVEARSITAGWWTVAVLTVLYTSSFIDRQILGLLVGPIRRDLGISDTGVSLLQGFSFAVFYTFLGLPMGRLADKGSRKLLIATGAALWSLATTLCGAAHSFAQLFLARIGVGVGESTLTPAAHSLLADLFPPHQQGRAFSVYHTGVSMGQGLALIIGGLVIQAIATTPEVTLPVLGTMRSWQTVFVIIGLPGLILALLALTMREPSRGVRNAEMPTLRETLAFMMQHKRAFGCWLGGVSLYSIVLFGYSAWMPTVLIRTFGMAAGDVGKIYGTIVLICGPLGMLTAGTVADLLHARGVRDAHWKVIFTIGVIALPVAVAAPLMPTPQLAFVFVACEACFMNAFSGVNGAALALAAPPRLRGQVTAINFFCAALMGFGVGPTLVASFTDYVYGSDAAVGAALATVCGLVLPVALVLLTFARRPYAATLREVAPHAVAHIPV